MHDLRWYEAASVLMVLRAFALIVWVVMTLFTRGILRAGRGGSYYFFSSHEEGYIMCFNECKT